MLPDDNQKSISNSMLAIEAPSNEPVKQIIPYQLDIIMPETDVNNIADSPTSNTVSNLYF